jgi:hypothetical protein
MKDPSRLLSQTGSLEAQLLEAVRDAEPPAGAHDQVWKRLGVAAGAGAATVALTTPLAARAVAGAGTKVLAQTGWLSAIKWIAVVGAIAPAAGVGVHWIIASRATASAPPSVALAPPPVAPSREPVAAIAEPQPVVVMAPPEQAPSGANAIPRRSPASSKLDAESALLRHAREKLQNGDAKGALDDVTLMATRFPRGELAQEREVVAIQALLAQNQRAAAATRAGDFLRVHPSSPYADSLRQALKP